MLYGRSFIDDPSRPLPPRYMLSGGLDSTIRLWDTATGKCPKTFFGHVQGVWSLAGDTLRLISGANDGMVCLAAALISLAFESNKCELSQDLGILGPANASEPLPDTEAR